MSYWSTVASLPWQWVLLGGGIGGALNAASSNNLRLLPSWSLDTRGIAVSRVVRVGLLASSAVGAAASIGVLWALRGIADVDAVEAGVPVRLLAWSLFIGFVAARGLTSEADKLLLRLAVRNAAAAPAAHPEIAEAIDHAPPYTVYSIAVELVPRRRVPPHERIHVSTGFEKVHAQRL